MLCPKRGSDLFLSCMPSITTDAVSAAKFLVRHMYRPIGLATDAGCFAVAETEYPFGGDTWFWTDDNAKVLELLVQPELAAHYSEEAGEIFKFVQQMCRGPFMFRRVSTPRLELVGQRGPSASYYHSLMHLQCDLPHGAVIAGIRFHDNRTADNLLLRGNSVEFTYRENCYTLNVEEAITDVHQEQKGYTLSLQHSGELYFKYRWRVLRLGRIAYTYTIDARSMLINCQVVLDVNPATSVTDVVLTVGHDRLSHGSGGVHYSTIFVDGLGRETAQFIAGQPATGFVPTVGATYYSIAQDEIAGFALAVHSAPREPNRFSGIELLVQERGRLHFARARYRFDGPCRGARLVVAEDKMLTAGGFYNRIDDYADLMRTALAMKSAQECALDFSVSYDYGAELNAFSQYFAALSRCNCSSQMRKELQSMFDDYLSIYFELFVEGHNHKRNTIFSRQLAFVVLGLVTMHRTTGDKAYLSRLSQSCEVLLDFEKRFEDIAGAPVSAFMMGAHSQRFVFIDCHSAALLALTQAAQYVNDGRLVAAIDRGLGSYCIETTKIAWIDGPHKVDAVAASWVADDGTRHTSNGFWNYHAGLTLRFFTALRNASDPALQAIVARHHERMELFEIIMRRQIRRSITRRDDAVEIRSSILSTETNSETQPWATLGLLGQRR